MPQQEHQNIQDDSSPDPSGVITSFDELTKGLALGAVSRRKALRWMGGALVGAALASLPGVAWAQGRPCPKGTHTCPGGTCVPVGQPCGSAGCPPGQVRERGQCVCPDGFTEIPFHTTCCPNIQVCQGGELCCRPGLDCVDERCIECRNDAECPEGQNCVANETGFDGGRCFNEGQPCTTTFICPVPSTEPNPAAACDPTLDCYCWELMGGGSVCADNFLCTDCFCSSHTDCPMGWSCAVNTCCTQPPETPEGHCVPSTCSEENALGARCDQVTTTQQTNGGQTGAGRKL